MATPVRVVVISEERHERHALTRAFDSLPGIQVVAEVDRVCQMGRQAGHVDADCVVLDIDRYPLAGTLGLAQARGAFPDARIIIVQTVSTSPSETTDRGLRCSRVMAITLAWV